MEAQTQADDRKKYIWRTIGFPIAFVLIFLLLIKPAFNLDNKEVFTLTGVFVTTLGLSLVIRQMRLNEDIARKNVEWNKRKATFDYISSFNGEAAKAYRTLRTTNPVTKAWELHWDPSKADETEYLDNWRQVLNYFETLCCGIKHDLYDERIAYDSLRGNLTLAAKAGDPFIERALKDNARAYLDIRERAKAWNERFEAKCREAAETHRESGKTPIWG